MIQSYLAKQIMQQLILTFLAVILLEISQLAAQSIPELIQLSAENNLVLKALNQEYLAALEKGAQVSQRPDPEITAGIFALPIETRLGVQRFRLGAMQMIPQKGILKAKAAVFNTAAQAKLVAVAATQLNQDFQIKKAWLTIYELEKSRTILQRNIRIFEAMEHFTLAKVESGTGSVADVLRVNLKIQELKKKIEIIVHKKQKPQVQINQLLNRGLNMKIIPKDSLVLAELGYNMDTLAQYIHANHPLIRMFSIQQEVANKQLKVNQLSSKPTFGVGIDYILMDKIDNFEFAKNGRDAIMPKASIKIPLYKKKYGAKQREEELKIAALATQKENAKSQFLAKIDQAFTDYEEVILTLGLYQEQIRTIKGIIAVLETQYSAEGKGFDDLLQMQINLVNYDLLILKELVKSHLAKAEIERYLAY